MSTDGAGGRKVRAGHPVVIYDREIPIARIERIEAAGRTPDRLALLRAQGVVRPPKRVLSSKQLRTKLAALPSRARLVDALREDRESDR
jgi:antitoxin (DNA-binding transcriptional repressor) of toxin-antitoxin stability system